RIIIATLKPLAKCLCPQCLTEKAEVSKAGTAADDEWETSNKIWHARELIFRGYSLESKHIKKLLVFQSLNQICSAFSTLLSDQGPNVEKLLTPDLMHEFELGVYNNIFAHMSSCISSKHLE
ncbi:hypothetical protein K466DRAFT_507204, partial [Polyporus arcularius HHB13444]